MFLEFFYTLRAGGLKVSTRQWLDLMEALKLGMHGSSMKGFYLLCRAILCKSEEEYDLLDVCFSQYFQGMCTGAYEERVEEISKEMKKWLTDPTVFSEIDRSKEDVPDLLRQFDQEEIEKRLKEQLMEQKEEHNEGYRYVGTGGMSPFGNAGFNPNGIRVEGNSEERRAIRVAGRRTFRDFRKDDTLSIRQYQMAFRILRQYAKDELSEPELDLEATIQETCSRGGLLKVCYERPRKNRIRVLFLMDCGGTMSPYQELCSRLFQAISKSNHFKDLKIYYFHNCPHGMLYTSPTLEEPYGVPTEEVLQRCTPDYRVIFVGDAFMEMGELTFRPLFGTENQRGYCGLDWLERFRKRYRCMVWLNPMTDQEDNIFVGDGRESYSLIRSLFSMYPLTTLGLKQAMKYLMGTKKR